MADKQNTMGQAAQMLKNNAAVQQLLQSQDTKKLMDLLDRQGGAQDAAQAAAAGDPKRLMEMMQRLMSTQEGASLVERIKKQAEQSGL